jgi:anti-sigma-K factor RskA
MSAHDELLLAAPYALDALERAERETFERHLASCAICREEVGSLARVTDALGRSVPQQTPRGELRVRVLASIAGTDAEHAMMSDDAPSLNPTRHWVPLAAAILTALGLGVYAWALHQRIEHLAARLEDAEERADTAARATADARKAAEGAQRALAVLAAPNLVRIDLAGQPAAPRATARALWSRHHGMVFTVANLPPAPGGRVYQVWVVTAEAPVSAGVLTLDRSGRATVFLPTPADIGPPLAVAVTLEPAGGVAAPTGARFLIGTPRNASD